MEISRKWCYENHMVLNPDKRHYIAIGDHDPSYKTILKLVSAIFYQFFISHQMIALQKL